MNTLNTLNLQRTRVSLQKVLLLMGIVLLSIQPISAQYFTKILTGTLVETPKKPYAAAWADFSGDGFDDAIIVDSENYHTSLFLNNGDGTFTELTDNAVYANMGPSIACAWGDYNNDGNIDLYICNTGNNGPSASVNFLYRNEGNNVFTRITEGAIVNDQGWSMGAAWADYDRDGFLDLYVANFMEPNCLYHNNGDGTFTKITEGEAVTDNNNSYSTNWADYDNDGYPDIFVVNYFYSQLPGQNDCLYHNNGDGTFTKNTTALIANDQALTQGSSWGDFNNDGWLDLFVTVNDFDVIKHNFLYKNNGNGDFTIVNAAPSIDGGVSFGSGWLDMNNDGFLDLTVSNNGSSSKRLNYLYLNNGNETFTNQTTDAATTTPIRDYCTSIADYDHNGYPDIFTPSYSTTLIHGLYRNNGGSNNWLSVRLIGMYSNKSAIGARVKCYAGNMMQSREVSSTTGMYSGGSLTQTFGIGTAVSIDSITINWPSGIHQVIANPTINQMLTITEAASAETDILTFQLPNQIGNTEIDGINHTVSVTMPSGTNLSALAPAITVSTGATINPASGELVDFSAGPVNYTVTAQNGSDQQLWIVTVAEEVVLSGENDILALVLPAQIGDAVIDPVNHTVSAIVPNGTGIQALAPVITISANATINPASGAVVDFSAGPVNYTVTAQNGNPQVWVVTITEEVILSGENDILTFVLPVQVGSSVIDPTAHTIQALVPNGTGLQSIAPVITVSPNATVNPASGVSVDFSAGPVDYTVTAQNGNTQVWVVTVTEELLPNNATDITAFILDNEIQPAEIDIVNHTVMARIPFGAPLSSLSPTVMVSEGAVVVPASGVAVDFSNGPVIYTVTAENGTDSQSWMITVHAGWVGVNEAKLPGSSLAVFPNPSGGKGFVSVVSELSGRYQFDIQNQAGQLIDTKSIDIVSGQAFIAAFEGLKKGLYLIRLTGCGKSVSTKMLVTE